jgi:hypothetical protein
LLQHICGINSGLWVNNNQNVKGTDERSVCCVKDGASVQKDSEIAAVGTIGQKNTHGWEPVK